MTDIKDLTTPDTLVDINDSDKGLSIEDCLQSIVI